MFEECNQAYEEGKFTKMITLEVGTKFHVKNGDWVGEIVLVDGVKCIKNDVHTFKISDSYECWLQICK